MKRKLVVMGLMMFAFSVVKSQTSQSVLSNVIKNYRPQKEVISTTVRYRYFKDASMKSTLDTLTARYMETSRSLYTNFSDEETLMADSLLIYITHQGKTMSVYNAPLTDTRPFNIHLLNSFLTSKVQSKVITTGTGCVLSILTKDDYTDSIKVFVDLPEHKIKKAILYFSKYYVPGEGAPPSSVLEITYVDEKRIPLGQLPSKLRTSSYLSIKNDQIIPTGTYKTYQVLN